MWVKFRFTEKDGKTYKLKSDLTVKEAKELFNKEYKNNDNIVKVWLTHFATWHEYHYETLKDITKKGK